jgi:2-keto-3-deoxy-L-rhamnonate aldolase RhmA
MIWRSLPAVHYAPPAHHAEEKPMIAIENAARRRLEAGELAIGVGVRQARTVEIGKAMKTAGFDWLFIDMEHGPIGLDAATQIAVAAQDAGITPIVRVPGFEHYLASRALDAGALGIVFPHVDDAATAARLASYCRFPPVGKRSMTGALPQVGFASHPIGEMASAVNAATLVVVMLETPQAIDNAEAIAAVPGVDALLIGTNDLCAEMGIPGEFAHDRVLAAYDKVVAACRAQGTHPGMGGVYTPQLIERYVARGMRLILAGSDFSFMMAGAKAQAASVRAMAK